MFSFLDSISKLVLGEVQQNNFNYDISEEKDGIKNYFQIVENKLDESILGQSDTSTFKNLLLIF